MRLPQRRGELLAVACQHVRRVAGQRGGEEGGADAKEGGQALLPSRVGENRDALCAQEFQVGHRAP